MLCTAALGGWPAATAAAAPARRSALLVFVAADGSALSNVDGLSVGIMSAAQGRYSTAQFLLDVTQGARIAASAYPSSSPPALSIRRAGPGALVVGWQAARRRAEQAPQLLRPGLLASQLAGGGGYAGIDGADDLDGAAAADLNGHIAALSLGTSGTLLQRTAALEHTHDLVVADLPAGAAGVADLRALMRGRPHGQLMIVVQRVPDESGHALLWSAAAGLPGGGGGHVLSSASTEQRGLIVSVDLAPTILDHLGVHVPADMRGRPIENDGALHASSLGSLMRRLQVLGGRRLSAFAWLLCAWALLVLIASPWPRARARAMRAGALAVMWTPVAVLIPAALEPSAPVEYATIVVACVALGALSDALLPWPRAVIAPALFAILALTLDALTGTQLLMRSLLGPNPILGARFHGIGNELKSGLAVLVLAAVAAALYPAVRGRRAALAMAGAGVLLAVVEGSDRIGAGVGGVILVSFAFAIATVMLLSGALTRRGALIVLITPVLALAALAALDLATAHGGGHFTGSVLHARSASDLRDLIVRRYSAAWGELHNHAMPVATVLALIYATVGLRRRDRLLAPVGGDPAWLAALAGGLAAGVVGALVEDSGPVLLVVAMFSLGCVATYLWGRPEVPVEPAAAVEASPQRIAAG